MTINAEALNIQMKQVGLNQNALAEKSGVSAKTIGRILKGGHKSNPATANRIVDALNTTPEALATPPDDARRRDADECMKNLGFHRVSFYIEEQTALNFALLEHRYGLPALEVIKAAPLFATILAEMSLADRRKRLEQYGAAFDAAMDAAPQHLKGAFRATNDVGDAVAAEEESIAANDLGGRIIDSDEWVERSYTDETGIEETRDLFAEFLQRLVSDHGLKEIGIIGGAADNLSYDVFSDTLERLTNGDYWAGFALLHRHTRIRDIPEDMRGEGHAVERAEWLAARVPEAARKAHEDWIASMPSLDDLGLGDTTAAVNDGGQGNA